MGAGAALEKTVSYGFASLLREIGRLVSSSRASLFISLIFILGFPFFISVHVFAFIEASTSNVFFSF